MRLLAVLVLGDTLVLGVIASVQRRYVERGDRSVVVDLNLRVVLNPLLAEVRPADGGIRYALGDAGEIYGALVPGVDRAVVHRGERRGELDGKVAVLEGHAALVAGDALVHAVV